MTSTSSQGLQQRHVFLGFIVFVVLFILGVELQYLRGEICCFTHKLTKSNFIFRHFNELYRQSEHNHLYVNMLLQHYFTRMI